jgi:hypothetical protein
MTFPVNFGAVLAGIETIVTDVDVQQVYEDRGHPTNTRAITFKPVTI